MTWLALIPLVWFSLICSHAIAGGVLPNTQKTISLCHEILEQGSELSSDVWLPVFEELHEKIQRLDRPGGHGLTSFEFKGVLSEHGLLPGRSDDAWVRGAISLSDLHQPDGFLASIGFANRNDYSSYAVVSEDYTGRDIVDQFADVNPYIAHAKWRKPILKIMLRALATRFAQERPMRMGEYPVYLVFDLDDIKTKPVRPDQIPSELMTKEKVPLNYLRIALVPAGQIENFIQDLHHQGIYGVDVYPLELIELHEIYFNPAPVKGELKMLSHLFTDPLYQWLAKRVR